MTRLKARSRARGIPEEGDWRRATRERQPLERGAAAVEPVEDVVLDEELAGTGGACHRGDGRRGRRRWRRVWPCAAVVGARENGEAQRHDTYALRSLNIA